MFAHFVWSVVGAVCLLSVVTFSVLGSKLRAARLEVRQHRLEQLYDALNDAKTRLAECCRSEDDDTSDRIAYFVGEIARITCHIRKAEDERC